MDRIERVSIILNDTKAYNLIGKTLGIEIDCNSDIFRDIEQFIIDKFDEMDEDKVPTGCGFCGHKIEEDSIYCSYECSKADNTERV